MTAGQESDSHCHHIRVHRVPWAQLYERKEPAQRHEPPGDQEILSPLSHAYAAPRDQV